MRAAIRPLVLCCAVLLATAGARADDAAFAAFASAECELTDNDCLHDENPLLGLPTLMQMLRGWGPALWTGAGQAIAWTRSVARRTEPRFQFEPALAGGLVDLPLQRGLTLHAEAGWARAQRLAAVGGFEDADESPLASGDRSGLLAEISNPTGASRPWMQLGMRWKLPTRPDLLDGRIGLRREGNGAAAEYVMSYRRTF